MLCADLQLCGVLLNKIGSAGHGVWLAEALAAAWQQQRLNKQVQVLGCIPKVGTQAGLM
jgi:cobyrinic acid a,c-diamide synthase